MGKKTGKPMGRPKKRQQAARPGAGRKPISFGQPMSDTTKWRRAKMIADYVKDAEILQKAHGAAARADEEVVIPIFTLRKKERPFNSVQRHSPDSAAAYYLENNYSKRRWCNLVTDSREQNAPIYPCYDYVQTAFVEGRPRGIIADNLGASVPLQNLLNTTSERAFGEVALNWPEDALQNSSLTVSWGMDSSGHHLNPHQKYTDEGVERCKKPDQSLFVTSVNVISIQGESPDGTIYEWKHPKPQSRRMVRPLRIKFEKEDDENTITEYDRVSDEVSRLNNHTFILSNGKSVNVNFRLFKTLFDGKCINAINRNKYTLRCAVCWKVTKDFGDSKADLSANEETLYFGLGLLHVVIKVFEYLLHLAYRNIPELQIWDIPEALKKYYNESQAHFKELMWKRFDCNVDLVLQGKGTSNTGKIAMRCLMQPEKLASTLNLDEKFVKNVSDSLRLFRCKQAVNYDELEKLMRAEHARHFVLYPWAKMSPSMHRFLWHGCGIGRKFPLPMIYFSEDGSEASNKYFRKDMVEHARQCDRTSRILDVFHRATDMSDPKFALMTLSKNKKKSKYNFNNNMKQYLVDR
ncbi:hypothetical protein QAD02_010516 [Eretmocerus hayati]|uniref:Uncharacterized protein n=1 Tax=Eretmocerus hayati TaxID=131215 RepID=A0ACC2NYP1_9HYME|nr:hypothetical protein QAD02_010516 [Eretmocerus hayati]